jgi:hypothetical protein
MWLETGYRSDIGFIGTTRNYKELQRRRWSPHFTNAKSFAVRSVIDSRSLATVSKRGDSSASRVQFLLSQPHVQSFALDCQPPTLKLSSADLGSSLYSMKTDPKVNTVSSKTSVVSIGGYLAIARILLTWIILFRGNVFSDQLPSNGLVTA